jgi:CubicO group peptidase (beta-lactamase class C family)
MQDRTRRIAAASDYDFAYPVGEHLVYSDLGLILLGEAVSRLSGQPLENCIDEQLARPLRLERSVYNPLAHGVSEREIAPTEVCAWRQRRLVGEVDDENAASLAGVSGHAGLFSTAEEVGRLGSIFLNRGAYAGRQVLEPQTVAEMTRLQVERDGLRRGLAWVLWTPAECVCGRLFGASSFGHTGFTGTSLWIDARRELMVVALTNRVYYGREAVEILRFRPRLHDLVVEAIERLAHYS